MKWSTPRMPSGTVNSTNSLAARSIPARPSTWSWWDAVLPVLRQRPLTWKAILMPASCCWTTTPSSAARPRRTSSRLDGYRLWGPQGSTGTVFSKDKTRLPLSVHRMWQKLGLPESFEHQELEGTEKDILVPVDVWGPMHARWEDSDLGWYFKDHGWVKDPWSNGMRDARHLRQPEERLLRPWSCSGGRPGARTGSSGWTA